METPQSLNFRQFNNYTRLLDNFYAKFFKLPENMSNLLGANLRRMSRPSIEFESTPLRHKGNQYQDKANARFSDVTFVFDDDEESITSTLINIQVLRQLNKHTDVFGMYGDYVNRDYRFDVQCELLNSQEQITEAYILKDCFIKSVDYTEVNYSDDTRASITVIVGFDNIHFDFKEEYTPMLDLTPRAERSM